jgi:hypothetical protein
MGHAVARFVFTDGPFNRPFKVAIGGEVTDGEAWPLANPSGEMTAAPFLAFHRNWIEAVLPYLVDGGLLGTFIDGAACRSSTRRQRRLG